MMIQMSYKFLIIIIMPPCPSTAVSFGAASRVRMLSSQGTADALQVTELPLIHRSGNGQRGGATGISARTTSGRS